MDKIGLHVFISGHVQGVFYRRFARDEALKLEITGWACNLPDGRVELLLCGEREAVEKLLKILWIGPSNASVTEIKSQEMPWENDNGFVIR